MVHLQTMDAYDDVDHVIAAWVKETGSTLFTGGPHGPARYFHIPGEPPFECFQISVKPPVEGRIVVFAAAIDTNDDTELELEQRLEGSVEELDDMLASAVATIERWKVRPQQLREHSNKLRFRQDGTPLPSDRNH